MLNYKMLNNSDKCRYKLYMHIYICIYIYMYIYIYVHKNQYIYNILQIFTIIYLSIISIYPSIHPSIHLSIHLSIYLSIYIYRERERERVRLQIWPSTMHSVEISAPCGRPPWHRSSSVAFAAPRRGSGASFDWTGTVGVSKCMGANGVIETNYGGLWWR
jgi:hypothetical protein